MEKELSEHKSLEQLQDELATVARRIMELDAAGNKGDEWNQLHLDHERLTKEIEEAPIKEDLDIAA